MKRLGWFLKFVCHFLGRRYRFLIRKFQHLFVVIFRKYEIYTFYKEEKKKEKKKKKKKKKMAVPGKKKKKKKKFKLRLLTGG